MDETISKQEETIFPDILSPSGVDKYYRILTFQYSHSMWPIVDGIICVQSTAKPGSSQLLKHCLSAQFGHWRPYVLRFD
eukprot:2700499-Amphidinium_carterae.2